MEKKKKGTQSLTAVVIVKVQKMLFRLPAIQLRRKIIGLRHIT